MGCEEEIFFRGTYSSGKEAGVNLGFLNYPVPLKGMSRVTSVLGDTCSLPDAKHREIDWMEGRYVTVIDHSVMD